VPTYWLDTFHPELLRCDGCGAAFPIGQAAAGADDLGPEDLRALTADEVALALPQIAGAVHRQGVACPGAWFAGELDDAEPAAPAVA
jgi:hypothetical protein